MDENWIEEGFRHRPTPEESDRTLLEYIIDSLDSLHRKVNDQMTDITELTTDVTALTTAVSGASAALDDLASQVANLTAGEVTQDQIDALDATVQAANSALGAAVTKDDPTPTPAPAPVVDPPATS